MSIEIIFTDDTAQAIMKKDHDLLDSLTNLKKPILHIYHWKNPSITYGHFIKIENMLQLQEVDNLKIDLAKRPTGGGVIFHLYDYAFSFLMPSQRAEYSINPLDNYSFVNQIVHRAITPFIENKNLNFLENNPEDKTLAGNFCMAKPTIYDLMVDHKKIVGAAQRNKKQGYLHQGSIALQMPAKSLLNKILKDSSNVSDKMNHFTHGILDEYSSEKALAALREEVKSSLIDAFQSTF